MDKKGVLPSPTQFVRMKDQENIFSCHYFATFPSFCTEVRGDTEKENPSKKKFVVNFTIMLPCIVIDFCLNKQPMEHPDSAWKRSSETCMKITSAE